MNALIVSLWWRCFTNQKNKPNEPTNKKKLLSACWMLAVRVCVCGWSSACCWRNSTPETNQPKGNKNKGEKGVLLLCVGKEKRKEGGGDTQRKAKGTQTHVVVVVVGVRLFVFGVWYFFVTLPSHLFLGGTEYRKTCVCMHPTKQQKQSPLLLCLLVAFVPG